jgi:MFS transporter, ACS family, hexuronate transporter
MRWVIILFLFLMAVINFADKAVSGFSAIHIMKELKLSYEQWGMVGSSFYWLFILGSLIIPAWSDRIGTKKVLALMAFAWTLSQLSAVFIVGLPLLLISRIWLGFFEGPFIATAVSQMTKWFPPEKRGLATSIINAGSTIGSFVSAPVLVAIIETSGWRMSFEFLGLLSLLWVILWMWLGKEKPTDHVEVAKPTHKVNWSEVLPVFRTPTYIFTCLAYFAFVWFLTWTTTWMPAYLVKGIHLTPKQMGNASAITGVASLLITIAVCWFSDRLYKKTQSNRKSRVYVAGISLIVSAVLFYTTTLTQSAIWAIIVLSIGKGLAYTISPLGMLILMSLLPERKGLLSGIMVAFGNVAGIIAPWVTGVLVQWANKNELLGFNYSILCFAALFLLTGILFLIFSKPDQSLSKLSGTVERVENL